MFITPSFKKSLIVEQFQGNYLKHCTRQIYFFYIFIQRYTFYLLIFQWTDTKLIVNLELRANSFVVEFWKESLPPEQRNTVTLN